MYYATTTAMVLDVDPRLRQVRDLDQKTRLVMAAIKSARNAHALINKLPDEILERIFLLVQPYYGDFLPKWPGLKSLEWTAITRVCRRWRLIATSYSALWTTLDADGPWSLLQDSWMYPTFDQRSREFGSLPTPVPRTNLLRADRDRLG